MFLLIETKLHQFSKFDLIVFYKRPSLVFNFSLELKCKNPFAKQCMYKVGGFTIETYSVGNCSIRSFRDKFDYITFLRTAQRSVSSKKFYNSKLQYILFTMQFYWKMNDIFSNMAKSWYFFRVCMGIN